MPIHRRRLLAAALALPLTAGAGCVAAGQAPLAVFAAASLKEAMDAAALAWRSGRGGTLRTVYASSPALARQVMQGAPADVIVTADAEWMDVLEARGRVDAGSRTALLGNTLVLVAPRESTARPLTLRHGIDLRPLLGDRGRIALAMVDSVPAGRYARAAFESLGAWDALAPRVAAAESVRAALMLVARGEAPLGVVYASDAHAEPRVRVLATFPPGLHPPIVYPVARVAASRHPRAAAFLQWLRGDEAGALFRHHGFALPPGDASR